MKSLLWKAAFEFQYDKEYATSCSFDYGYGIRDVALYRDMSGAVFVAGVFLNGCP